MSGYNGDAHVDVNGMDGRNGHAAMQNGKTHETQSETNVENKYVISDDDVVGRGAWSVVKRCRPVEGYQPPVYFPDMRFVVKMIEKSYLIELTSGDVDRAMAEVNREIDVLRSVPPHPNIVTFVESIETATQFLLIFEEVQCGDLCELILRTEDARISEERSKRYTYQTIKAVLHCHLHDVIHRDIKPENLLVDQHDDIRLTDFGLAKCKKGLCTSSGSSDPLDLAGLMYAYPGCEQLRDKRIVCSDVIGTPRYGAPEMFYAKFTQTHYDGLRADTWSVGVVTYITLSGSFPYSAGSKATEREIFRTIMDTPLPHINDVSATATDFVQRILCKDPSKRMTLYEALDHPWLESCVEPRGSVTVPRVLSQCNAPEVKAACQLFDEEARALHLCMAKLRREILMMKEKERPVEDQSRRATTANRQTSPQRRAETPMSASKRSHPAHSPMTSAVNSARVSSPRQNGIAPGRGSDAGSRIRRPMSASRVVSGGDSTAMRSRTPLARSTPHGVRRGTPLRAGLTPVAGINTSVRNGSLPPKRTGVSSRSMTPNARSAATAGNASQLSVSRHAVARPSSARSKTPTRSGTVGLSGVSSARDLQIDDNVTYKGLRAIVRFNGPSTFGSGIWIGLEMLEGNEGTNDGASFIDKRQYFTCPKGKGLFVRPSQVKKIVD